MKNRIKACVISFCILLCGCGASDTGAYLLATQETESQIPTESEVLVPDTEVVSERGAASCVCLWGSDDTGSV